MNKDLVSSFKELRKNFDEIRTDFVKYVQPKIGAIFNERPAPFGAIRWVLRNSGNTKRVYIDLYATGSIVFDLKSCSDFTAGRWDFVEPDLEPKPSNFYNLYADDGKHKLDELVKKIKQHLSS